MTDIADLRLHRIRSAAGQFRDAFARIDGPGRAANIVERAFVGVLSPS